MDLDSIKVRLDDARRSVTYAPTVEEWIGMIEFLLEGKDESDDLETENEELETENKELESQIKECTKERDKFSSRLDQIRQLTEFKS
jgi:predicted nuclease with TOPRIM domain